MEPKGKTVVIIELDEGAECPRCGGKDHSDYDLGGAECVHSLQARCAGLNAEVAALRETMAKAVKLHDQGIDHWSGKYAKEKSRADALEAEVARLKETAVGLRELVGEAGDTIGRLRSRAEAAEAAYATLRDFVVQQHATVLVGQSCECVICVEARAALAEKGQ